MNTRSKGVTFYAVTFILFSFFRFFGSFGIPGTYNFLSPLQTGGIVAYSLISNIGLLYSGFLIFKLKESGRRLALILTSIGLVYMLAISAPLTWESISAIKTDPKYTTQISQAYKDMMSKKDISPPRYIVELKNVKEKLIEEQNKIGGGFTGVTDMLEPEITAENVTEEEFSGQVISQLYFWARRGTLISALYLISILVFFNLPKVKRQFMLKKEIQK